MLVTEAGRDLSVSKIAPGPPDIHSSLRFQINLTFKWAPFSLNTDTCQFPLQLCVVICLSSHINEMQVEEIVFKSRV